MDSATWNVIHWVRELRTRRMQEGQKEYKTSVILAVLEILEANPEHPNRFEYRELLPIFKSLVSAQDENVVTFQERQFSNPYLRLENDNYPIQIWLLQPVDGVLEEVKAENPSSVRRNYPYAKINESVWSAFTSKESRVLILKEIHERFDPSVIQPDLFDTDYANQVGTDSETSATEPIEDDTPVIISVTDSRASRAKNYITNEYLLEECSTNTFISESKLEQWIKVINLKKQVILYGPPGTGKTFIAEHLAMHLIGGKNGFYEVIQFHPAYTYEDFIQGIRPQMGQSKELLYLPVKGRFLDFCEEANRCEGKDECVLIIDEINRANLAQVFGELMYLLEYREKTVSLAGGEPFQIPDKVRIIGTMNTADRSIAPIDYALRRRFAFISLHPDYTVLSEYHKNRKLGFSLDKLISILKQINQSIDDPSYEIGVSFFLKEDIDSILEIVWRTEIEPYLEEYFFRQKAKMKQFKWEIISDELIP